MKHDAIVSKFNQGVQDGREGRPKQTRGLNRDQKRAYENGYAEGHQYRSTPADRPAYYDAEGGSMCNGIGRDYI